VLINEQLKPLVGSSVAQQAGQITVKTVNEAVQQVLAENPLPEDYLSIERDSNGEIQSINANTTAINTLKAKLNLQIQQSLDQLGACSVAIPIGTLIGGYLFRGLGPGIHLRFTVASNVSCNIVSKFDSAGVNQTRHSLSLEVSTDIYAMIPGCSSKMTTMTSFPISENIIVGKVPDLYWSGSQISSQTAASGKN